MKKRLIKIIIILFFIFFSFFIHAEDDNNSSHIIILKDGNEYKGQLKDITEKSIIFEINGKERIFNRDNVTRIQFHKDRLYSDIDNIKNIKDEEIQEIWKTAKKWEPSQNTQVVILLDKVTYDFKPDNKVIINIKKAFKVLNEEGKNYSTQYFYYLKNCSKADLLYGITILPDGNIKSIEESAINDEPINNEIPQYDDLHRIKFGLKDVDIGSVFVWEAKIERTWDLIKNPLLIDKQLVGYNQVEKSIIQIKMPKKIKLDYKIYSGLIPIKKPSILIKKDKNSIIYTIEQNNIENFINDEKNSPSDFLIYPAFYAGINTSWQKISNLYYNNYFRPVISDKMKMKAREITDRGLNFEDKLSLLYNYINREISLADIEMDYFSYSPIEEEKLLTSSSLNVLDKSYLFTRLANSLDIPVKLYLYRYNFKNEINNDYPTLKLFDSAICEIEIDKKPIFFSFEDQNFSIDQVDYAVSSAWALDVSTKNSKIIKLKKLPYDYNKYIYKYECFLKEDGTLYINRTTTINGEDETTWRRKRYLSKDKLDKYMESRVNSLGNDVILEEYKFINNLDEFDKPVVINEKISVKNYSYNSGKNIKLLKIPELKFSAQSVNKIKRILPFKFDNTMLAVYDFAITFPDKYKAKYIPSSLNLNFDGFSFKSNFSTSGNKININIEYYFSKDLFPVTQYSVLKDCFEKLAKLTEEWILLEADHE